MADLGMELDHESVERSSFDPIPAGTYLAQIKASEVKPTKAGTGRIAKFQWEILEGLFERRVVFDQVNYQNPNATAQLIGQQRIKAICEAVGHSGPLRDTADVEFKPCRIRVTIEGDDSYGDKNVIKDVKPANGGQPPARSSAPQQRREPESQRSSSPPPQQRAPAGTGGAAWRR